MTTNMFLKTSRSGYTRQGEQFARGSFLILFSHNQFKWAEENGKPWQEFPAELTRKLYATVRHVSLRQMGPWMMGTARIAGQSVTVSGAYGGDGLTRDYESLTPEARAKLIEMPIDITDAFWSGGGHNDAGNEGPIVRAWAKEQFTK